MNFSILAVSIPAANGKVTKLVLLALASGVLIVGRSPSYHELFHDYCEKNKMDENQQKIFATGWVKDNRLVFDDGTPVWKRKEITEFLAARALILSHLQS